MKWRAVLALLLLQLLSQCDSKNTNASCTCPAPEPSPSESGAMQNSVVKVIIANWKLVVTLAAVVVTYEYLRQKKSQALLKAAAMDLLERADLKMSAVCLGKAFAKLNGWSATELMVAIVLLRKKHSDKHKEGLRSGKVCFEEKECVTDLTQLRKLRHTWILADAAYQWDEDAVCRIGGFNPAEIVKAQMSATAYCPAYFVANDQRSQSLVICVRGTRNVTDILTDLSVHPHEFMNGYAHEGVVRATEQLYKSIKPLLVELKRQQDETGLKKRLLLVGHSLGGGVAALIALLVRQDEDFSQLDSYCYTFAPPATISEELVEATKKCVTSVINEHDLVPRVTLHSVDELKQQAASLDFRDMLSQDPDAIKLSAKAEELADYLTNTMGVEACLPPARRASTQCTSKIGVVCEFIRRSQLVSCLAKAWDKCKKSDIKPKNVLQELKAEQLNADQKREDNGEEPNPYVQPESPSSEEKHENLTKCELLNDVPKLVPPGRLLHLCVDADKRTHVVRRENSHFSSIALAEGLFVQHLLDSYRYALDNSIAHQQKQPSPEWEDTVRW